MAEPEVFLELRHILPMSKNEAFRVKGVDASLFHSGNSQLLFFF